MRLYNTEHGPAREAEPGILTIVDLPDLGDVVRDGGLDRIESAPCVDEVPLADARLLAPVPGPGKVIIVGLNYGSHGQEALARFAAMGMRDLQLPTLPNFYIAAASAVTGPGSPIRLPQVAPAQVDYEGEVAVVIGRDGADISSVDAWKHVAGLTIVNDISARDIQQRAMTGDPTATIATAKSFDTFKPLGPCLVTADEFGEPLDLRIRTRVNNELRQDDPHEQLYSPDSGPDRLLVALPRAASQRRHLHWHAGGRWPLLRSIPRFRRCRRGRSRRHRCSDQPRDE
jgi:2-keto-4-pentenoate hydratase/2-oxohepta-3-ene-1,7-dioic acid hydratase in catechol pathway